MRFPGMAGARSLLPRVLGGGPQARLRRKQAGAAGLVLLLLLAAVLFWPNVKPPRPVGPLSTTPMEDPLLDADLTIHVVFVGFAPESIDTGAILTQVPPEYQPRDWGRSWIFTPTADGTFPMNILFRLQYEFHNASEEFATGLWATANASSRELPPTQYLTDYDTNSGMNRLGGGQVQTIHVTPVEQWIIDNRAAHDLAFDEPQYTIFLLDSYTKGYLPKSEYHYWEYPVQTWGPDEKRRDMRAWGGNSTFMMLDVGAAPSDKEGGDTATKDPPIWHFGPTPATTYGETGGWDVFNQNLGIDIATFVQAQFVKTYIYKPIRGPVYVSNNIFVLDRSQLEPDLVAQLDFTGILDAMRTYMPFVPWDGDHKILYLPEDDPGMYAAMVEARGRYAGAAYKTKTIINYIDQHPEKYARGPEGWTQMRMNLYVLPRGASFEVPGIINGFALPTSDGKSWGCFGWTNDVYEYGTTPEQVSFFLYQVDVHEVGHSIGLTHPWNSVVNSVGEYDYAPSHISDKSYTIMSYRMRSFGGDEFELRSQARAHALLTLEEAVYAYNAGLENLAVTGAATVPKDLEPVFRPAYDSILRTEALFAKGRWFDSYNESLVAWNTSQVALNATGGLVLEEEVITWSKRATDPGRIQDIPFLSRTEVSVYQDYQPVPWNRTIDHLVLKVEWDNGARTHANMYAGWSFDGSLGAVFDQEEQTRGTRNNIETFTIGWQDSGMRNTTEIFAGAGLYNSAAAVDYTVTITVHHRASALALQAADR